MTQLHLYIIITVSNQSTTNFPQITNLPKFIIKFQKQKLIKDVTIRVISAFVQNNSSNAEHWFNPCRTRSGQLFSFL